MTTWYRFLEDSPCGRLAVAVDDSGALVRLEFLRDRSSEEALAALERACGELRPSEERTAEVVRQLDEYFAGDRREFGLTLRPAGTDFQLAVWSELSAIPFGGLRHYGEVAGAVGRPGSARAVGRAVGTNPIPIVIPCHRVVGKDDSLTGFGGGLPAKEALLRLEGHRIECGRIRTSPALF